MLRVAEMLIHFGLKGLFDQAFFQLIKQTALVKKGLWTAAFTNELLDELPLWMSGIRSFFLAIVVLLFA